MNNEFYNKVNSERIKLKIDLNNLNQYQNFNLAEVIVLSLSVEKRPDGLSWTNDFNTSSINKELDKYFKSIIHDYIENHKEDFNVEDPKFKSYIAERIKSDVNSKTDLMLPELEKIKRTFGRFFHDRNRDRTKIKNRYPSDKLIDTLAMDIIDKSNANAKVGFNHSVLHKKIVAFLYEVTIRDLVEYGIDLNHKNLKDGIPLLSIFAEFSKEIGIKFDKDVRKLSDLTRSADTIHWGTMLNID